MNLPANPFLNAIRSGKSQIGIWVTLANPFAAEIVAGSGFDWALVDMEHSPNDLNSVMAQLQVFASYDTTAIVRPEWNDQVLVKRLLDAGTPGLLFPMVQSPSEAESAVRSTRYPPRGIRGVSGSTRANKFGRIADYFSRVEDETAVLIQVETQSAVALSSEIGALDGVDGVFFGPADIAADMGLLGKPLDDAVWDLILPAAKKLIGRGIPVGTLVTNADFAKRLVGEGFGFVACGTDAGLLAHGADALAKMMRT